jgi:diguanylate cyclase (GGDEF)-like protein
LTPVRPKNRTGNNNNEGGMASTTELIAWRFHAALWPAVVGMGWLAAFVALDLARRIPASVDPAARRLWLTGAALALGTGIWSNHFIGLVGEQPPLGLGYGGVRSALAWLAAVAGAAVSLGLACGGSAGRARAVPAALVLGLSGLGVEVLCFADLAMAPTLVWNPVWMLAAALAIALGFVPFYRWLQRSAVQAAPPPRLHQVAVAALAGLALAAAHQAAAWAAQLPGNAVSLHHLGVLSGNALALLASVGSLFLLAVLLLLSVMESRMRSALQSAAGQIVEATQNDALTGLLNRRSFERCLEIAALRADADASALAVLFVGLDGFKPVNDTFGRHVGDQLLVEMARRIHTTARPGDKVARVGGDEFAVLMAFESDKSDAAALARRLIAAVAEAAMIDGRHVQVTGSVGMVLYPQHGVHSTNLAHAEAAAHSVKRSGGAACAFFEPHMLGGAREQLDMLRDLRLAIKNQELELFFQPKIHAPSGEITGAEALMRWHHPQRGMVSPAVFIPLAERYGLINELGNWLIEDACRQARAWRDAGLRMRVAINLSVHQLGQDGLVERIRETLARHRIEPKQLTCEITESAAMDDTRATLAIIEQLSSAGVHLSIDDFGTGYSSLAYLRKLPAEELKIDRSFVLDLETSADARAVVDAVVQLAKALGLKVVAEGVETEAQQQILRSLGCDELQGYLFAKPMSAQALLLWAMNDDGPRPMGFRDSLFQVTMPAAFH